MPKDLSIRHELAAGDLGRIVSLHGEAYAPLPGFGQRFEAYVASTVAEYVLDNDARGRIWLAEQDGRLIGCTAIALRDDTAQLRWVVVDPAARSAGLGGTLVDKAIAFCRSHGCASIYLFTTDGLPASQALYEKLGFRITSNELGELWDGERPLIRMQLDLRDVSGESAA
jgi:GNAT superfamily N-acetyltransferase